MSGKNETKKQKKFLEPAFHFITKFLKIGEDYTTDKIPVTELVKAGKILADFPNFQRFASKGYEKAPVELGDNTEYSEDKESIVATVAGYPKVTKNSEKDSDETVTIISVEPVFKIGPDNMKATLVVHPPVDKGQSLQDISLKDLLDEEGIVFGVDESALEKAIEFIEAGDNEFKNIVIAKGQIVGESEDAYLRYDLEIGPIAGTLLEDGSIDFRERRIMVGIKAGELIATKIPAVQGTPGIDVYGKEKPAKEGKDLKIQLLNDARFSPETLQVKAIRDGVLSIVNNNVIKVCSHQVINKDIDYETGNIESMNAVTVRGSVQPGFKISTEGDLQVTGSVMSAKITCHGNLVIKGGITGNNSKLEVQGDADINFIEQGTLTSGGLVVIRKQSYYSKITAGADIRCKNSTKIMGGSLIAEGNISLGDVGSENAKPAIIAAGVVAERLLQFNDLKESVVQQQDAIIQWLQRYRGSSKSKKIKKMEQALADTKLTLLRLNLIPGTGIYSRAASLDDGKPLSGPEYSSEDGIAIHKIKIDVPGTLFAGTRLQIGNCTMILDKTVTNRQLKLHANQKRIIAGPVKR